MENLEVVLDEQRCWLPARRCISAAQREIRSQAQSRDNKIATVRREAPIFAAELARIRIAAKACWAPSKTSQEPAGNNPDPNVPSALTVGICTAVALTATLRLTQNNRF